MPGCIDLFDNEQINGSLRNNLPVYAAKSAILLMCFAASVSYVKYGATFLPLMESDVIEPSEVDFSWFSTLSPYEQSFVIYCCFSALTVNATFQYGALNRLYELGRKECFLFLVNKKVHPFLTELCMSILAAVPGSAIAGSTFSGEWQWFAKFFGFVIYFTYSFLGTYDLIHSYDNQKALFLYEVLDKLRHLNPEVYVVIDYWGDKALTQDTVDAFLEDVFLKAELNSLMFLPVTPGERRGRLMAGRLDWATAGILTSVYSFIFIQSGYSGINALANNRLSSWTNIQKIAIGVPFAFPLILFSFFISKVVNGQCGKTCVQANRTAANLARFLLLLVISLGCSTWGFALASGVARDENIFSPALNSFFGHIVLPVIAYLSCLIAALNGLTPMVLETTIKTDNPEIEDVVRYLERNNEDLMPKLKRYGYFLRTGQKSYSRSTQCINV
jgi:hypothetical protein